MESLDDRPSAPNAERPVEESPDGGKVSRIASHTQGLFADLREWIDLRVDLAILEMEERLDAFKNDLALGLTVAVFAVFAAFFSLTTVALGVGWLLGHPFWGFLAVSVALILIIVTLRVTKPALMPPSNLFESLRGERAASDEGPSSRPASAAVDEADGAEAQASAPDVKA
ncbi:hypothetical protein GGQ08_000110 [Salinibacter ruber]|uniref:phage holin family protein n=1 Tax=Salinibacter ruber TaxID=146919 RepID=UPI00216A6F7D|nr:phage holin family protein [Salinibacter ruber]MCS3648816.1 hypothetical protein [Salinibacter ruber]MCS3652070.1 hypothetical protein [Salinibacter ruber]